MQQGNISGDPGAARCEMKWPVASQVPAAQTMSLSHHDKGTMRAKRERVGATTVSEEHRSTSISTIETHYRCL